MNFKDLRIVDKKAKLLDLKNMANNLFKANHLRKAVKIYQKIEKFFISTDIEKLAKDEKNDTEDYKKIFNEAKEIKKAALSNEMICHFKLKENNQVIKTADKILAMDVKASKALYFKAKALKESKQFEEAMKIIKQAESIEPNNEDIKNETSDIKGRYEAFRAEEKKKYAKLFKK